jgi:hypothetical protein
VKGFLYVTVVVLLAIVASVAVTGRSGLSLQSVGYGEVCGVVALAGGPEGVTGVHDPTLLHQCPAGSHLGVTGFELEASNGQDYRPYRYEGQGWSARLPAGAYVTEVPSCPGEAKSFSVKAGHVLQGVLVRTCCECE